jgi:hypothetical protein
MCRSEQYWTILKSWDWNYTIKVICTSSEGLTRASIARGYRTRQYSLLCLVKSIPCCRAQQNKDCRARNWRVSSQIGAVLRPAAEGYQRALIFPLRLSCGLPVFLSREEHHRLTVAALRRWKRTRLKRMHKRTNLPCTNSCARQAPNRHPSFAEQH